MARSVNLARQAINVIATRVSQQTLNHTTYCAAVVKLANSTRAVMIAEAGASASGISDNLMSSIENQINAPVIGCADPTLGQGTWHMNDAEKQALKIYESARASTNSPLENCTLKAIKATRNICESCRFTLQNTYQMQVNADEAQAP